jgi:hypothetical protein
VYFVSMRLKIETIYFSLVGLVAEFGNMSWIYNIWRNRNALRHGNNPWTEKKFIKEIKWEVKTRFITKGKFKKTIGNDILCSAWGIDGFYFDYAEFFSLVFMLCLWFVGCRLGLYRGYKALVFCYSFSL